MSSLDFFKSIIPREIKDKDAIFAEIPGLGWPITNRQLVFIIPSFALGITINVIGIFLFPISKDFMVAAVSVAFRIIIIIGLIAIGIFLSNEKINGLTYEKILFKKINHRRYSSIVLNERARRAIMMQKKAGGK